MAHALPAKSQAAVITGGSVALKTALLSCTASKLKRKTLENFGFSDERQLPN